MTQVEIYQSEDGALQLPVSVEQEIIWLSLAQMCELFDKNKRTISEHIRNLFKEGGLPESAVVRKFRTTANNGNKRSGGFLFIDFLHQNNRLYHLQGKA